MDKKGPFLWHPYANMPASYVRPESDRPRLSEVSTWETLRVTGLCSQDRNQIVQQAGAGKHYGFSQVINHGSSAAVAHDEFYSMPVEKKPKLFSDNPSKKIRLPSNPPFKCILVNGPVIVGAGPSGLAVGAGLRGQGVRFVMLERADCIAPLWQNCTYDRLKLQLPKKSCQLPGLPLPEDCPEYPTKYQFNNYLESYAQHYDINPRFNETVQSAKYDETCGFWQVKTISTSNSGIPSEFKYICRWLVVATGENAEKVLPEFEGLQDFGGHVMHSCDYKSGESYRGKRVLVVGCGNSGMEVSLDLCNHNASPSMVVRSSMRAMLFDIGAEKKIRSGEIKVVPGIKRFYSGKVELVNDEILEIDSVILATGYRSNVPSWLKENELFSEDGIPKNPFPNGWKGDAGLYAVGFTMRGLVGASLDSVSVALDIAKSWKERNLPNYPSTAASC